MMKKYKFNAILLLAGIYFFSCQFNGQGEQVNLIENRYSFQSGDTLIKFGQFISKFKLLSYPFTANTSCYEPDTVLSVPLDMDNDSIFIRYVGPGVTVGMLPDTSDFYVVIYCIAAACYIPQLAVYSKNGEILSMQKISKGCGAGQGYTCLETLTINSLKDIIVINNEEQYDSDSSGIEISDTHKKTVYTNKYSINEKGIIEVVTSHIEEKK